MPEGVARAQIDGHTVAYARAGAGPPVVLLHGGISDHREWRRPFAALSGRFDVVAWDAPGCGGSSDPPETFRTEDYADVLAGLIDALGLRTPHVVGLSWGGGLAIALAHRHPGVPASLTLAGAYAGWAGSLPADVVAERLRACMRQADLPPGGVGREWLPGLLSPDAPPGAADELLGIMLDVHPAGFRAMARSFATTDLRGALPGIAVPTLVIHGERDLRSPVRVGEELAARIPGARLVVLPGVGHMVNVEAAGAFTAELAGFFDGLAADGPT